MVEGGSNAGCDRDQFHAGLDAFVLPCLVYGAASGGAGNWQ